MPGLKKIGRYKTEVFGDKDAVIKVVYFDKPVVTLKFDGTIILSKNGWASASTKARMNQASNQFNLGYKVFVKESKWWVTFNGHQLAFKGKTITLPGKGK